MAKPRKIKTDKRTALSSSSPLASPSASSSAEGQPDPRAPLNTAAFLAATERLHAELGRDLGQRVERSPAITRAITAQHEAERAAGRTGDNLIEYTERLVGQIAAAWILSVVFVRVLEDRGLLGRYSLAGPGARDRQRQFLQLAPYLSERDYLGTVFREMGRYPALADLFDPRRNLAFALAPSVAGARALLELVRMGDPEAPVYRFGQSDTRFLGDLYQELDEEVRKRYALLQTPHFVESFILDRTLEPALIEFGLEGTALLDPACGSGHFLLGAFERLYERRLHAAPGPGERGAARWALGQVFGVDINPYAVSIARFRLLLAYLGKVGCRHLGEAPEVALARQVVVADSLLHNAEAKGQVEFGDRPDLRAAEWKGELFELEDEVAVKEVLGRRYAAVVGNPPYITPKDPVLREKYRETYRAAAGKYALAAPFTERFFGLAREGGFVGMINANSFMKREFGKRLIEVVLKEEDLELVVNTAGAYIPGHGTPTVLLFGRRRTPVAKEVLAVLGKRGEPATPEDPERGLVWSSIAGHWNEEGFENEYISVARIERATLAKHPWSLGGGGAAELKETLEEHGKSRLGELADSIGISCVTGEDDLYILPAEAAKRRRVGRTRSLVIGELVRDWSLEPIGECVFPFDDQMQRLPEQQVPQELAYLWPCRSIIRRRKRFGVPMLQRGLTWYELQELYAEKLRTPLTIAFAFVATHNHFVLDRGGKVFKQSAPIIKLPASATEDDHLALLAYLNSSIVCFWMKQVAMNKGGSGIGRGIQDEAWEARFEFDGTKLSQLPVPDVAPLASLSRKLDEIAARRLALRNTLLTDASNDVLPLAHRVPSAHAYDTRLLARMVALQEELDWLVYERFGLLTPADLADLHRARGEALPAFPQFIDDNPAHVERHGLHPGHRPFEVVLAARVLANGEHTAWFERNGYRSPSEIRDTYAPTYQHLIETRIRIIERNPSIALIEQPEYKRRWTVPDPLARTTAAVEDFLLDALERAMRAGTEIRSDRSLVQEALREAEVRAVAALQWKEDEQEQEQALRSLLRREAVPFLAAWRYSDEGLKKRRLWVETWALQRREDAGETLPPFSPPPKYNTKDFRDPGAWRHRGKLDVPKERFISYPGCESDEDNAPVYGWAGWDHREQALALGTLYSVRKSREAWPRERLLPLLAGLEELLPWLQQWHNQPSPDYDGQRLGDFYEEFVAAEALGLGLQREDLGAWRPPARGGAKGGPSRVRRRAAENSE